MATPNAYTSVYLVLTCICEERTPGWLRTVGACLYVSREVREWALRALTESRAPVLTRAAASALGGNAEVAHLYALRILRHIRELIDNPHIPDTVSSDTLTDVTPNYVNTVGFVPSPARLNNMVRCARRFEDTHGDGDFTRVFLRIYPEALLCASRELQSRYDVFVSHVCLGYSAYLGASTRQEYVKYHFTYLVLWYALLIEYIISS